MTLTLEVTGPQAEKLGPARRAVFDHAGGTIGKQSDNALVLPHDLVSRHHAVIQFRDGRFYIEDTSTNGVVINSTQRLVKRRPHALESGDAIFIKPFDLRVSISGDVLDPFGPSELDSGRIGEDDSNEQLDPLKGLGIADPPSPEPVPRIKDLKKNSGPSGQQYRPPRIVPPDPPHGGVSPISWEEYDPSRDLGPGSTEASGPHGSFPAPVTPTPSPEPRGIKPLDEVNAEPAVEREQRRAASPAGPAAGDAAIALAEVLEGAGLDRLAVTPELAQDLGRILRVVVSGVMDVLRARQEVKDEFRMRMTRYKHTQNNPLKLSVNVEDALHNLLVKRNAAYLSPVEAFEDAFNDIRNHQVAVLAGVRAAFEKLLADFDPDRLQAQFDKQTRKGSLLELTAGRRYWEQYRTKVEAMTGDMDSTFRTMFGEKFVEAYEEQLKRMSGKNKEEKP